MAGKSHKKAPSAGSRKPVDIMASECMARRVLTLTRTVSSIYNEALRPLGLTVTQLNLLVVVAQRGPISPSVVAKLLNMDKSTLSRNIRLMEGHGWLSVLPGDSGRGQTLAIRAKGRNLVGKALPLWQQAQKQTGEVLGEREARSVYKAANTLIEKLGR